MYWKFSDKYWNVYREPEEGFTYLAKDICWKAANIRNAGITYKNGQKEIEASENVLVYL